MADRWQKEEKDLLVEVHIRSRNHAVCNWTR